MIKILIIDDSIEDVHSVLHILKNYANSHPFFDYTASYFTSLASGVQHLQNQNVLPNSIHYDLLLLDLAFDNSGESAVPFLQSFSSLVNTIIISHLDHYQRFSSHSSIVGFISKKNLSTDLPLYLDDLFQKSQKTAKEFVYFPSAKTTTSFSPRFETSQILYIFFHTRNEYSIFFTNSKHLELKSVPFSVFLHSLQEQGITSLCPISRNEIININYIKEIHRDRDGRIEIKLINQNNHTFHISPKYLNNFHIYL